MDAKEDAKEVRGSKVQCSFIEVSLKRRSFSLPKMQFLTALVNPLTWQIHTLEKYPKYCFNEGQLLSWLWGHTPKRQSYIFLWRELWGIVNFNGRHPLPSLQKALSNSNEFSWTGLSFNFRCFWWETVFYFYSLGVLCAGSSACVWIEVLLLLLEKELPIIYSL